MTGPNADETPIDLAELGFAIALSRPEEGRGEMLARQVRQGKDGVIKELPLELVRCSILLPEPYDVREGYISNPAFNPYTLSREFTEYLCFNSSQLVIQGNPGTIENQYVEIYMQGCSPSQEQCNDADPAEDFAIDIVTLRSHVDLRNDADQIVTHTMDSTNRVIVDPSV